MADPHSRWECAKCGRIYVAPLVGQEVMGHRCRKDGAWRKMRRVWRSKYDRMKG